MDEEEISLNSPVSSSNAPDPPVSSSTNNYLPNPPKKKPPYDERVLFAREFEELNNVIAFMKKEYRKREKTEKGFKYPGLELDELQEFNNLRNKHRLDGINKTAILASLTAASASNRRLQVGKKGFTTSVGRAKRLRHQASYVLKFKQLYTNSQGKGAEKKTLLDDPDIFKSLRNWAVEQKPGSQSQSRVVRPSTCSPRYVIRPYNCHQELRQQIDPIPLNDQGSPCPIDSARITQSSTLTTTRRAPFLTRTNASPAVHFDSTSTPATAPNSLASHRITSPACVWDRTAFTLRRSRSSLTTIDRRLKYSAAPKPTRQEDDPRSPYTCSIPSKNLPVVQLSHGSSGRSLTPIISKIFMSWKTITRRKTQQ
ncbi:hypothetical protein PtA15_7A443 [Puccinia triticina]|uniref:Uncharacterized protein n=1 Tax=Puccinia triticina TaxID=208348 RepID=A0ABY7CPW2_9BASI|nr:uncharacterized protein PtA15_7A443 [Puccinia triticina]WAQ86715.1 hypothetical protein PtA15_7A443 [Puccinia triticina]